MPDIKVGRATELLWIVKGHLFATFLKARAVVDAVGIRVGECKVGIAEEAVIREALLKAGLQAVVAGIRDVPEFGRIAKSARDNAGLIVVNPDDSWISENERIGISEAGQFMRGAANITGFK
jgi:hypothetical protein